MGTINSDKAWKAYGKKNPYYGVITDENFTDENLTDENLLKFFNTGEQYVKRISSVFKNELNVEFQPKSALDFGCGTGRIVIPLAKRCESVVGVDISEAMLAEAKSNATKFNLDNTSFVLSDDSLSKVSGQSFDLVNTYIVLQHMNVDRGMKVIQRLVDIIKPGGLGVIHVSYRDVRKYTKRKIGFWRSRIQIIHNLFNVLDGKPWSTPLMQMNTYDLNKVFEIIQHSGVKQSVIHHENHDGVWSVAIFFKKP